MPKTPNSVTHRTNQESGNADWTHQLELDTMRVTAVYPLVDSAKAMYSNTWAAIEGDARVNVALAALLALEAKIEQNYALVANLLNAVSYAYIVHTLPQTQDGDLVVLFDRPHTHCTKGDYLGINARPDWVCYAVTLSQLKDLVLRTVPLDTDAPLPDAANVAFQLGKPLPQGWPRLLGVGEGKPDTNPNHDGQFLKYLGGLKRARPDLATVYGFRLSNGVFRISSLNACGIVQSELHDREEIAAWVAYVLLVYESYNERDAKITHRMPVDCHVRCDITLPRGTFCFVPASGTKHPGRMTWVAFQVGGDDSDLASVCAADCTGIVKVSWQDVGGAHQEIKLLEAAHKTTWLPGLVRHWSGERDLAHPIKVGKSVTRVKDTLHLASVGDPLSKCASLLQLFKVIFDLSEVHLQLLDRGIIHRDVSWYNVLCNPWHHPDTLREKSVARGMRFIEQALTGIDTAEPHVLLTDLDHSAFYPGLYADDYKPRVERSGTPGFMAVELASDSNEGVPYKRTPTDPSYLIEKFKAVEKLGDVYTRAIADDNGKFMKAFTTVCEREVARIKARSEEEELYTDPGALHLPAHDVESMFWVLVWTCLRACPEGANPLNPRATKFMTLADSMIGHEIGSQHDPREPLLMQEPSWRVLLHERLAHVVPFFRDMATYLSIPWRLYADIIDHNHAHLAMRRLLLAEIHKLHEHKENDVKFDIYQPRIVVVPRSKLSERMYEPPTRDRMTSATQDSPATTGQKRKAPMESGTPEPAPKKVKTSSHKCRLAGCNVKSAGARCEKLWDKWLWFGQGYRKPPSPAASD